MITLEDIKQLTADNDHTTNIVVGVEFIKQKNIDQFVNSQCLILINKLNLLISLLRIDHPPTARQQLMQYRMSLYCEMMAIAEKNLPTKEFVTFKMCF